ncbi:DoxX family protein [Tsukamurella sp. 8F]|uniref:DoxX family protein n=1 Tax=unclassified Tsukamurella TaxID=2633480 RepID=UPI0023B8D0F1|nr:MULTISPECIES: DoxX family protein [unclassified Tsukamurella]MDF0528866.1 DoxX family protein [Tsukamurella sp. 8J]MDF0586701.1 DoxX family protein [Tsukamurella sp. 8F]
MIIAYWFVGGLLAVFYLYAGGLKVLRSRERLRPMMAWVDDMPMPMVRGIGSVELLGAVGLILPPLTGLACGLAPAAATGFVVLQVAAIVVHLRRGDRAIALNIGLLVAACAAACLATAWQ